MSSFFENKLLVQRNAFITLVNLLYEKGGGGSLRSVDVAFNAATYLESLRVDTCTRLVPVEMRLQLGKESSFWGKASDESDAGLDKKRVVLSVGGVLAILSVAASFLSYSLRSELIS